MRACRREPQAWCTRGMIALLVSLALPLLGSPAIAQLADSPWPMANRDARHTGRSEFNGPGCVTEPSVAWHAEFRRSAKSSPIIGPDGTIYLGIKKSICAFEPADGAEAWCWRLPATMRRNAAAINVFGLLFIGARDNRLWALDSTDPVNPGNPVWFVAVGNDGDVNTSAAVTSDGTVYMVGTFNGVFHALDQEDGSLRWPPIPSAGNVSYSSPAVGPDGTVYYGTTSGHLRAIRPEGTVRWDVILGGRVRFASPAIDAAGRVYIGTNQGLVAVDPDDCDLDPEDCLLWTFETAGRVSSTPAIVDRGNGNTTIYVGSIGRAGGRDARFYALDQSGAEQWGYTTNAKHRASPVVGANEIVYIAAGSKLLAFPPGGGAPCWEYQTLSARGRPMRRHIISSPAISDDGKLYFGANGLYALE